MNFLDIEKKSQYFMFSSRFMLFPTCVHVVINYHTIST